jgi:lipopolysaccharide heptosyltransferase II
MRKSEKNVLVILIAGIGDLIMASKALRALSHGYRNGCLHLLTSTGAATLARNYPYVHHVWSLPVRELRREKSQISGILKTIFQLRKTRFDTAVNLYRVVSRRGALRMGLLFRLLKAGEKVGHDSNGLGLFLDKKAPVEIFQNRHFVDAMTDIAVLAGGVPDEQGIDVFWDRIVETKWASLISSSEGKADQSKLIGINPGADRPQKRWNPAHYAYLGDRLVEHIGAKAIILGGPGEEHIAQQIQGKMKFPSINLAGKLTLNDLVYVIGKLDLLITNDSGPMHIGAAARTPLVAIFGPEDPTYTRPYTSPNAYRIVYRELDCRPCRKQHCDQPQCLELIEPEEVLQKCFELLK